MTGHDYTCAACGGEFTTDSADADARAHEEAIAAFGRDGRATDMAEVCDDCYRKIMAWAEDVGDEELVKPADGDGA